MLVVVLAEVLPHHSDAVAAGDIAICCGRHKRQVVYMNAYIGSDWWCGGCECQDDVTGLQPCMKALTLIGRFPGYAWLQWPGHEG